MLAVTPNHWPYSPRLLFTVAFLSLITLITLNRQAVASAAFALYLVAMLTMESFTSPWLLVGWAALAGGFALSDRGWGPKPVLIALASLLVLHALAIPGSLLWGTGNWELTAGVVMWMAPAVMIYAGGTATVLNWLVPVWLIHAGVVIHQGLTNWYLQPGYGAGGESIATDHYIRDGAAVGLANNVNLAGGFLAIGIIFMISHPKLRWLTPPLFMALLFTGSRWALLVTGVALVVMGVTRRIAWQPLVAAVATLFLAVFLLGVLTPSGYQIAGYDSFASAVDSTRDNLGGRLAVPHIPSFLPSGVAEHSGLHNVPLRIAVESGILAAVLWVGITLWAAMKWRNGVVWWILLTLLALSMLDYYPWMGHLGGFWWLSIGILVKGRQDADA
jgi:hypothetical protein